MFFAKEKSPIDKEIDRLALVLRAHPADSKEYGDTLERLSKLSKIRAEKPSPDRLSWNTAATITANLVGIAMITFYEHEHVVSSKAIGFIKKV